MVRFLDGIAGPGKLIEKFSIKKFERDPDQKDRILLDIHMVPYFPAKTFLVSLDGTKGDDPRQPRPRLECRVCAAIAQPYAYQQVVLYLTRPRRLASSFFSPPFLFHHGFF